MKKAIVFCIIFSLLASFALAQNKVYNELGSNGLLVRKRKAADATLETGFGGFYDTIFAKLSYQNVGSEVQFTLKYEDFDNLKNYTLVNSTMDKAYVWINPMQWMQIVLGPKYCQSLPGSFFVVYDDYSQNGIYGEKYFGINVIFDMVQGGFSIPKMANEEDGFRMEANFGINGTIPIGGRELNIGATYKMTNKSFGVFASYGSLRDIFYVGGGYTFNGTSIFLTHRFKPGFSDIDGKRYWGEKNNVISLTGLYNGPVSVGADLEVVFAEDSEPTREAATLLYTGILVSWDILDNLTLKFTGSYGTQFYESKKLKGALSVDLYPRIIFTIGNHCLMGGMEFNFYDSIRGVNEKIDADFGFAIPVSWRYTF